MKVAVTGATGFVGKYLVNELLARGDQLLLLGRDIRKLHSVFGDKDQNVSLAETEYGKDLPAILKSVDAIVHASGLRWRKDKKLADYLVNNVIPTEALCTAAADSGIKNIVFMSSIAVYNTRLNALPFTEDEDLYPPTHYGLSKLLCEKIGAYYNSEFGLKVKSLRIGQVVGMGERDGFMLGIFMDKAICRQALTIFGQGVGARDYVYILDVVSAILCALGHPDVAAVYNVSLGKPVTHLHLAEIINRAFGNSNNLGFASDRAEDTSQQWMSCERAWRELGWRPQWDLDEMFADLASKMANREIQ